MTWLGIAILVGAVVKEMSLGYGVTHMVWHIGALALLGLSLFLLIRWDLKREGW
jgi:hypothetical protein